MSLRVHNAARAVVTTDEGPWHLGVGNGVHGGAMTAPVDLGNRGSDLDSVQSAWLPGTHTVMLQRFQRETDRSEEHTSELQSRGHLVCRLLLEKKKNKIQEDTQN